MLDVILYGLAGVAGVSAIIPASVYSVKQQTNVVIERFGKFKKISNPGLHFKIPLIDRKAGVSDLRIQQLDIQVETKTKDNVFVNIAISVQYQVNPERVYDSHYRLSDHKRQITSYVFDTIRAAVPTLTLDEVFERKDDLAKGVADTIGSEMGEFGYNIVKTLVSDVNPNEGVKAAMNDINAAQRKRVAAQELAEAEKIKTVTDAEAKAEAQRLQGVGLAEQRKAIIEGFSSSLEELKDQDIDKDQLISVILFTQYLEAISELGRHGNSSIMLPGSPSGAGDMLTQVREAIITGNLTSKEGQVNPPVPLFHKD